MLRLLTLCLLTTVNANYDKSITIVLDVTNSMRSQIDFIRQEIEFVLTSIHNKNIVDYILISFSDKQPDVMMVPTANRFAHLLDMTRIETGNDCPENSLTAIIKALEVSHPRSYVYVFTDAQAKDYNKIGRVKQLCHKTNSQVSIFLSGKCLGETIGAEGEKVYYDITKNCSGSIFHLNINNYRQPFAFIKEISKIDWTSVENSDEFYGNKQFSLTIDEYTTNLVIAVSGYSPTINVCNKDSVQCPKQTIIMRADRALVIDVEIYEYGTYTVDVNSKESAVATIYMKKVLNFQCGFSPKRPRNINETASGPLPDTLTNIFIVLLPESSDVVLVSVQILWINHNVKDNVKFEVIDENKKQYIAEFIFPSNRPFQILILGNDATTQEEINGQSDKLKPQERAISSELLQKLSVSSTEGNSVLIDYDAKFTLSCKIIAHPKPEIWWENSNGDTIPSENALLEYPMSYISYVHIDRASKNDTFVCKARNDIGTEAFVIQVYINRTLTFNILQQPNDTTIEYDNNGALYCEVDAYPEAEIKWFHNDTQIEYSDNIQIVPEEHKLFINKMSLEDVGEYRCEVSNEIETKIFTASVSITGLESPEVDVDNKELILSPGDQTERVCTVLKGKPIPMVSWRYKAKIDDDLTNVPEGVFIDGNALEISSAEIQHGGIYVCEASNVLGTNSKDVEIKVQYAPKINNTNEDLRVNKGDLVELPCDVDAVPKANVHWELYQDDVVIAFDNSHVTDDKNVHRFQAKSNDSGMYQCTAENSLGRAIRKVNLNVLVGPYIQPPLNKYPHVRAGSNITLLCNIIIGNPLPFAKWQFENNYSQTFVLKSSTATASLDLVLQNVSKRDEGTYQCVANNTVNSDVITIKLSVY